MNLEKFKGIDYQKIAELLIEKGYEYNVANNLKKFEGLDSEVVKLLIEKEQ